MLSVYYLVTGHFFGVCLSMQSDSTIYNVYTIITINEIYDIKLSLINVVPFVY
jgi:hypothetical protein